MFHQRRGASFMPYAFFQFCSNVRRMTCFGWQLTHDITVHIIGLSLEKSCFEINMKKIPSFTGCHLTTHSKSWSCGRRRISLLVILLFVLETSQYPSGLCLEEIKLFVRLDGEHPSSCDISSRLDLSQVDEIKNLVVNPGCFASANSLQYPLTSWTEASFRARGLILALVPAAFPQVAIQRSNISRV